MAVLNWGVVFRLGGRRLLAANPLRGAVIPREKNAKRPLATEERYQKLLEVADRAEPEGRLRLLLALARHTGRRINALANLRASDVLLSRDQMVTALAMIGAPIAWAEQWPHGALRFSAKFDKRGYESVIPLSGGIPSAARSRPSVAIFPTSTSWRSRDGVRRASCARATSTQTDRLCSVSSNPSNRARSRAKVAQTGHRRKRIDCAVRPYLGSVTFSPIETSAPVMRSGARRLVGCFLATGRTVIRP